MRGGKFERRKDIVCCGFTRYCAWLVGYVVGSLGNVFGLLDIWVVKRAYFGFIGYFG